MTSQPKQQVILPNEELDWIQMRQEYDSAANMPETTKEKMIRKIKENPVVPVGCLLTVGALGYGLYNFRTGNRRMSQLMMRARLLAQGFTVTALVAGVVMTYGKKE